MAKHLPSSALEYVLWSLVPYSEPNLKLVFRPNLFFNDLGTISRRKQRTLQNAYYKAVRNGLIDLTDKNQPQLTHTGRIKVQKFKATKLGNNAHLMVIFDIPEAQRKKRQAFRRLLQVLEFEQIQKSVWLSRYDHQVTISEEILNLEIKDYVKAYESLEITS